jgi:hypothetical protein
MSLIIQRKSSCAFWEYFNTLIHSSSGGKAVANSTSGLGHIMRAIVTYKV